MPVAEGNYTLTFSPPAKGWPSFYSYVPEWMQGMNQYFYSFSGGDLYRHNTNEIRNQYYGEDFDSTITSVFNEEPVANKLFKTLALEGDHAWGATLVSELQSTGFIEATFFEEKESDWFAYVRNQGTTPASPAQEFPLRSVNGIGNSIATTVTGDTAVFGFALTLPIGSIPSIGDSVYYALIPGNPTDTIAPVYLGQITAITVDIPNGINTITAVRDAASGIIPTEVPNYVMTTKNLVAESHGILGHYGVFTLTNSDTEAVELFAVKSEVMKSYP